MDELLLNMNDLRKNCRKRKQRRRGDIGEEPIGRKV